MRRVPLKPVPPPDRSGEPGYRAWHVPLFGTCACCSFTGRLFRHHVVKEQHVRQLAPELVWDLRNSWLLGAWCRCHRRHHDAARKLPASRIPPEAIEFAIELYGPARADGYIDRHYSAA